MTMKGKVVLMFK